jgi:hypothetical protein
MPLGVDNHHHREPSVIAGEVVLRKLYLIADDGNN